MIVFDLIKQYFPSLKIWVIAVSTLVIPIFLNRLFQKISHFKKEKKSPTPGPATMLSSNMSANVQMVKDKLGDSYGLSIREFRIGGTTNKVTIIYINGLADEEIINNNILQPIMDGFSYYKDFAITGSLSAHIKDYFLPVCDLFEANNIESVVDEILKGQTTLLLEQAETALILKTVKMNGRAQEEPPSELLVRGPRVGFNENLQDNITLLRKAGVNTDLRFFSLQVGERFKKELIISYVDGVADPALIEQVKKKVEEINLDNVPESGYLEQLMEDNYLSIFPQIQSTERPDRVIAALTDGRVALLLDGTPFALLAPVTINMFFQSPEDYYERWLAGSLVRLLRYVAAFIAVFTPSLYISFVSFHQGLIPSELAFSIIESREGVPFPILIEALLMEVSIEILREAGLRLPKPIGQTIGIVGGLVIGDAAVQAGIVSPVTVIVVALTAIASFSLPQYNLGISLRLLRFVAMFLAASFGLYGVIVFFLFYCIHLVKLKSFGVPYLSPIAPTTLPDWKDYFFRMPLQMLKKKPQVLNDKDNIPKG